MAQMAGTCPAMTCDAQIAYATPQAHTAVMPSPDPCLCGRLRRASRTVTRIYDAALQPVGLTVTQFSILRTLLRLERPTLTELAEETAHEKSGLWRTLQPIIRAGWIEATTGRVQHLALTDNGMMMLVRALPLWRETQAEVDKALGARSRALADLLGEVEARI